VEDPDKPKNPPIIKNITKRPKVAPYKPTNTETKDKIVELLLKKIEKLENKTELTEPNKQNLEPSTSKVDITEYDPQNPKLFPIQKKNTALEEALKLIKEASQPELAAATNNQSKKLKSQQTKINN